MIDATPLSYIPILIKDPDSTLDYPVDWSRWLAQRSADTIASVQWIIGGTLVNERQTYTDTLAVIWLSGGTLDDTNTVTCRITTAGGRVEDKSFKLSIQEK